VTPQEAAAHWSDLAKESAAKCVAPTEKTDPEAMFRAEYATAQQRNAANGLDPVAAANARTLAFVAERLTATTGITLAPLGALTVEALRERLRRVEMERYEIKAAICDEEGDDLGAAWHRCEARALLTEDPQDKMRATVAFERHMAAQHLRNGTTPAPGSPSAEEIISEMRRIAP
jgi:hypothetical protein